MHRLAYPDGEVGTSRAAAKNGIAMGLSAWSTCLMEDVIAQGTGNPYAVQVTLLNDRTIAMKMLKRAESKFFLPVTIVLEEADKNTGNGFKAILLTVDGVVLGKRLNEFRNSFALPEGLTFPNIESKADPSALEAPDEGLNYGLVPSGGDATELI